MTEVYVSYKRGRGFIRMVAEGYPVDVMGSVWEAFAVRPGHADAHSSAGVVALPMETLVDLLDECRNVTGNGRFIDAIDHQILQNYFEGVLEA